MMSLVEETAAALADPKPGMMFGESLSTPRISMPCVPTERQPPETGSGESKSAASSTARWSRDSGWAGS